MKQHIQLTDIEKNVLKRLGELCHNSEIGEGCKVSMLKLACDYLNVQSVKNYASRIGKSTQHIRRQRNVIKIDGVQFCYDDD